MADKILSTDFEMASTPSSQMKARESQNTMGILAPSEVMMDTSGAMGSSHLSNEAQDTSLDTELGKGDANAAEKGQHKFRRLNWKQLTICLIVEAIALGTLSIPSAFAKLGMFLGIVLTIGIGLIAIYTSMIIGQVKLKHPDITHYAHAVGLVFGRIGYELTGFMFTAFLIALVGSHVLTGEIAFKTIIAQPGLCIFYMSLASAALLFVFALPPTFQKFAVILGYVDFISIIGAILVTIITTGLQAHNAIGGLEHVDWSFWPPEDMTFNSFMAAVLNIAFAYSFAVCLYTFMTEMHTPEDFTKSVCFLGAVEILIYTCTGALVYAFVGDEVKSPALQSGKGDIPRIAFGIALPVIFISGSINSIAVGHYILDRAFENRPKIRYIDSKLGRFIWVLLIAAITFVAWLISQAIPVFEELLGIISSLFSSGFTFYFPAIFWFCLLKNGSWYRGWRNILLSMLNVLVLILGFVILGAGMFTCVRRIIHLHNTDQIGTPFTCRAQDLF